MNKSWQPAASIEAVQLRARMLRDIRAFFEARDVLEIETPLLSSTAVTDPHIDSVSAIYAKEQYYLSTSPEYGMKRFVAKHKQSAYQIARCFREGEAGPHHNPEFTMLEWYRVGFDMSQLMQEVEELLLQLCRPEKQLTVVYTSYQQLFSESTGLNPHRSTVEQYYQYAKHNRVEIPVGMATTQSAGLAGEIEKDAWLDWLTSRVITAVLPADQLTFVVDYPHSQAALARCETNADGIVVARRFECYIGTLEIANGYHELLDAVEQAQRFERDNAIRQLLGKPVIQRDKQLLAALSHGLPDCSGVAIGLDRLLLSKTSKQSLATILNFPWQHN